MTKFTASLDHITNSFGDGDERLATLSILNFIDKYPSTRHINIGLVRQLTEGKSISDQAILRSLQFLAGDAAGVLAMKFEFLDDAGEPRDISDVEARSAALDNINPFTGEEDIECGHKLLIYFEPVGSLQSDE